MKKLLVLVFAIALCLGVLCLGASADYSGTPSQPTGDGTAANPYQISSAEELYWFAQQVNSGSTGISAVLTDDITINENVLNENGELNSSSFTQWTPIGTNSSNAYTGTFDGDDHTISGLYYSDTNGFCGLFGYVGSGGQVKNVKVADSYINDTVFVGGVCGYNYGGTITNCSFDGSVTGVRTVGGVCGSSGYSSTITNCYNDGSVTATGDGANVGGVCGQNNGTLTNCYNTGSVTGTGENVGGVCGRNDGTITNCYNTGDVTGTGNGTGTLYVGGVCGKNYFGTIENCYNIGEVTGNSAGGVCGHNYFGTITNCYNMGNVSGGGNNDNVGGVCGCNDNRGTITNCYWRSGTADDGIGSDSGTATNVEPKTDVQFASGEVAWLLNSNRDEDDPWRQTIGTDTSPVLNSTHEEVFKVTAEGTDYYCNSSFTLPAAPGKSGYTFVGWSDGSNTYDPGDSVPITDNVTFTAVWREINIPDPNGITVTQPANGTVKVNPSNGSAGTLITVTATPDKGYELAYITVDGERITGNTFRMPDKAVTVSALFVPETFPFVDVKSGDWFYDYVAYVYSNGLMDGTSATTFEPNANMTRAMVWAILARIDGETVTGADWANTARAWAMNSGVSDGTDANGLVTREQFATMLYRYAVSKGYDVSIGESTNILSYADFDKISEYAIPAMQWVCGSGVITGVTESTLEPAGTATRAQCAAMLMRFVENVK